MFRRLDSRALAAFDLKTINTPQTSHMPAADKPAKLLERLDLLNHTAADIQRLIADGSLTTVELVKSCLEQIERHNYNGINLRAVIDAAPLDSGIKQAERLDHERATKGLRSPMHGIPVLVKVIIIVEPTYSIV
jgi:amidase